MTQKQITQNQINAIKSSLAKKYFDNKCQVTGVSSHKRGMVFHHKVYHAGDHRRDYPKGLKGDLAYFKHLETRVSNNPEDFEYITSSIHQLITRIQAYKNIDMDKLFEICKIK